MCTCFRLPLLYVLFFYLNWDYVLIIFFLSCSIKVGLQIMKTIGGISSLELSPLTPMPSISIPVPLYTTPTSPHFLRVKLLTMEGAKQLLHPHATFLFICQDLILTRTTPGNTKPQTGGALTTKPQCRQTTSSWTWSSTKCVCLHSGHAITTFCVLVDCIFIIDP